MEKQTDHWAELHAGYEQKDWANMPSLFAQTAIEHFPQTGSLLELGAGLGQDSAFFAERGYAVIAADINAERLRDKARTNLAVEQVDLSKGLPFPDSSQNIVYAHLSLHYFDKKTTEQLFDEIYRVLAPEGVFAFFTNSMDDPEYGTGEQIEPDYFDIEGVRKRYFSIETAEQFAHKFTALLLDNEGETYKDSEKGIHNLIRYIGVK